MEVSNCTPNLLTKYAPEVVFFSFNFGAALIGGDSVSAASQTTYSPNDGTLTLTPTVSGNIVDVTISGGTAGQEYDVIQKVNTTLGETLEAVGQLAVN